MIELLLWPTSLLLFWRRDHIRSSVALRRAQRKWVKGQRRQAEDLFEHALSFGLTDSRPYVQYASAVLEQGDVARATELLHNAVEVEPDHPIPLTFLGLALSDAGRQEEAMAALRKACERAPDNLLASSTLALARMRSGEVVPAADNLLKKGVADNLRLRSRLLAAVETHLRDIDRKQTADELFPRAVAEDEGAGISPRASGRSCFRRAAKALHEGKYESARALLLAAAERKFDNDHVRLYLAGTYLGLGDYPSAAQCFLQIPETSPLRGPALSYAGVSRYLNDEAHAALALLAQAKEAGNVHDFEEIIHYYRGLCLLATGCDELVIRREFSRALDGDWSLLPRRLAAAVRSSSSNGPSTD